MMGCVGRMFWRGTLRWKSLAAGMAAWAVTVVVAALVAAGLLVALRAMGSVAGGWVAHPAALVALAWFVGLAVAWGIAQWLARRIGFDAFWCGVWLWWGVLALVTAFVMPEMSFLWVVPALAAGIFGLAMAFSAAPIWKHVGAIVPAVVAGLLIFEIALPLYTAMGAQALPVVAVLLAALGTTLAPLVAEAPRVSVRRVSLTLAGATVVLAVIATVLPAYTAASPQRVTFEFVQNSDANRAEWLVATESGRLPLGLRFGHFSGSSREPFPWLRLPARAFVADAEPLNAPGPELRVLDARSVGGDLDVEAQLVSPRGAPVVALYFPPDVRVKSFTMQGQRVPPLSTRAVRATNGWQRFVCATAPAGGVVVTFVVEGGKRFDVVALDESFGLPAEGGKLEQERPANAVASQSGDVTVITRTVALGGAMAGK